MLTEYSSPRHFRLLAVPSAVVAFDRLHFVVVVALDRRHFVVVAAFQDRLHFVIYQSWILVRKEILISVKYLAPEEGKQASYK